MSRLLTLLGGSSKSVLGPRWTPVARSPLGPFPPGSYDRTIPPIVPAARDLRYYRGQFCGIRIPGAPFVPGANPANTDLVMTCLLDNYPEAIREDFLEQYATAGLTHLQRSIGHAFAYGVDYAAFEALSRRAREVYGLFCDQWLLGVKETDAGYRANEMGGLPPLPDDKVLWVGGQDGAFWTPRLRPIVARMLDAGIVDSACVCWQMDGMQQSAPGNPTLSTIAAVASLLPQSIPLFTHWINEAMAWWKTGGEDWTDAHGTIFVDDRFSFWRACGPYLTGAYHQGNTTLARTNQVQYQGRQRDTLNPFAGDTSKGVTGQSTRSGVPENFRLVEFECTAQDQFNGECSELEGDLVGNILACTKADGFDAWVSGYGNGARRADGTAF